MDVVIQSYDDTNIISLNRAMSRNINQAPSSSKFQRRAYPETVE